MKYHLDSLMMQINLVDAIATGRPELHAIKTL